jgi:VWFA-related protein
MTSVLMILLAPKRVVCVCAFCIPMFLIEPMRESSPQERRSSRSNLWSHQIYVVYPYRNGAILHSLLMRRPVLIVFAFAAALVAPLLLGQSNQTISEDEIRWGARRYVPQPPNAIRVQTNIVQVPVVVRDSNGKVVAGLKKSDFELFDNGHQVKIASFNVENASSGPVPPPVVSPPQVLNASVPAPAPPPPAAPPTPRYVAFFFDDTSMRVFDVVMARKAAESFVQTSLKPGDKIGIFTTSTFVSLDFTDNVPKLLETLGKLLSQRRNAQSGGATCPSMTPYQAYQIVNFYDVHSDAMDLAMHEGCGDVHDIISAATNMLGQADRFAQDTLGIISDVIRYLGRMPGHRMLVLASSGFMTQTLAAKQDKLIDEALNANVIINSLDAKGLVAEISGTDEDGRPIRLRDKWLALYDQFVTDNRERQNDPLAILAEGTGGHFYHNRNDLDVGLRELAAAPDFTYTLTFSPVDLKVNGAMHTLKVKLADPHGLSIQARRGYMAPGPNLTVLEKRQRSLDSAVLAADSLEALSAQVSTEVGTSGTGEPILRVAIHVDANKLPFETQGDRKVERLVFVTALFDGKNHFLTGVQGIMDLRLKKETLATILSHGLDAKLSLQAPPGNYRLRQVVEEVGDGRITAVSRNVQIQ